MTDKLTENITVESVRLNEMKLAILQLERENEKEKKYSDAKMVEKIGESMEEVLKHAIKENKNA